METQILWILTALVLFAVLLLIGYKWSTFRRKSPNKMEPIRAKKQQFSTEFAEEVTPLPIWQQKTAPAAPELPNTYNKNRLVLMIKDPQSLYVYWEVTANKQNEFIKNFGNKLWQESGAVLRLYDITGLDNFDGNNVHYYENILVNSTCKDWYVAVKGLNRRYCLDYGRLLPDGRFITLLRSNYIQTPRTSMSNCLDEEWMWLEDVYRAIGKVQYGNSSPVFHKQELPVNLSSAEFLTKDTCSKRRV